MKKPNIKNLRENPEMTQKIRQMMANTKKIKITLCLDEDSVEKLRQMAAEKGSKYQTLLNHILRLYLANDVTLEARVTRLEEELKRIKTKLAKAA
jgi:predicted DNA binding CopG/RHH family protein